MYFFYLAYTNTHVKIGRTKNLKQKISELISSYPLGLKIIFRREALGLNEQVLHKKFKKYHLHHKWFDLHEDIREFIDVLNGEAKPKLKRFRSKKKVNLYRTEDEVNPEAIRIVKTSRIVDTEENVKK